jgi:hypothetical protein
MRNDRFPWLVLSLWLVCCAITYSFAQTKEPVRERLSLQTDKALYLAGELVWLKAIATDANGRPSDLSKVGYVELLDDTAPQIQIKLALENGVGEGSFSLPPTLPTRHYRLVAYTRYMRNEGEAVYYDRLLPVINPFIPLRAAPSEVFPSLPIDRDVSLPPVTDEAPVEDLPEDPNTLSVSMLSGDSVPQVQITLALDNGVGEGAFFLPQTLPTGNYRLIAQTGNRRTEGEAISHARSLPVVPSSFIASYNLPEAAVISPVISTDRNIYPVRATGELSIEGLPEDLHTLSVSIAGIDSLMPAITANEDYKRLLEGQTFLPGEQEYAEYEGHIITGKLIDLATGAPATPDDNPMALLGFAGSRMQLFGGQVDRQGDVRFFTPKNAGIREVATAVLPSYLRQYRVDIQSPFARHTYRSLPALSLQSGGSETLLRRSVGLQVLQSYGMTGTNDTDTTGGGQTLFSFGEPDWRYLLDEYTRFETMAEVVLEFISGLRFRKTDNSYALSVLTEERVGFSQSPSLVLLDGIPLVDHGLIYNYNPLLIKEIEIYKGKYVFGGAMFDGLAIFKTYRNDYPGLRLGGSTQLFVYEGTQSPHPFPVPAYPTEGQRNSRLPDYRHTLLWKPQVEAHSGQTLIPFTTSDLKGDFRITVEGLTQNGKVIYATRLIKVE